MDKHHELNDGMDDVLERSMKQLEGEKKVHKIPDHLLYLLQCTKKEIKRKKMVALVRKHERQYGKHFDELLLDLFWIVEQWPNYIIEIILGRVAFDYSNRLALACFFHGNCFVDVSVIEEMLIFYNKTITNTREWNKRLYEFTKLFDYLNKARNEDDDGAEIRSKYFFFHMMNKNTMYYDGYIRDKFGNKIAPNHF